MDSVLWWSGVALWLGLGLAGALFLVDYVIEWTMDRFWTAREFLAFVRERLTSGKTRRWRQ